MHICGCSLAALLVAAALAPAPASGASGDSPTLVEVARDGGVVLEAGDDLRDPGRMEGHRVLCLRIAIGPSDHAGACAPDERRGVLLVASAGRPAGAALRYGLPVVLEQERTLSLASGEEQVREVSDNRLPLSRLRQPPRAIVAVASAQAFVRPGLIAKVVGHLIRDEGPTGFSVGGKVSAAVR